MFMPTAEEKKRLLRGTIPRARKLGVDDTLRGWSWSSPPLLSPYEVPLGLSEVANAYCQTGRDVYARRVLGESPEPNEKMLLGGALHETFRNWTVHAKKALYHHGAENPEQAMRDIRAFPAPELPEARALVSYEADAIEFRLREALGQFPRIKTDALAALVLPVTLGAMLDGAFLGLSRRLSTDLLNLGEPCILNIIFNDEKRNFHPLTLAGYALVLEAVHEFPVDVGVTVYANLQDDRLHIERDFTVIGDELRMEFIETRDEKHAWSPTSSIPAPAKAARGGAQGERRMYDDVHRAKGEAVAEITLDLPEELIAELKSRAEKSDKNTSELIREALELYFRQRPVRKPKGDISGRPEVRRAIQIQDDTRRRLEGSGYSGSAVVREMRDRDTRGNGNGETSN